MTSPCDMLREIAHRDAFGHWLTKHGYAGMGAEIGVFRGGWTEIILDQWPAGGMCAIDPWRKLPAEEYPDDMNNWDHEDAYARTVATLERFGTRARIIRKTSAEAAPDFDDSLTFAYIDASHTAAAVAQDIALWWPKLRSGGVLCGHDAYDTDYCHAALAAVLDFAEQIGVRPHLTPCTSWWFLKS